MKTLIWDVDDVLNRLTFEWFEQFWKRAHADCKVCYESLTSNPPHEVLGVAFADYLDSLDDFRATEHGRNLAPVPEVLSWFEQHGHRYRHIALTARPLSSVPQVADWVFRHYGRWIRGFGFVPSHRPSDNFPSYHNDKGAWLRWIGVGDVLIDDSPTNLAQAQSAGLLPITVPQPWNSASGTFADLLERLAAH